MTLIVEFDLPGLPPTTNGMMSYHWTRKSKEAKYWQSLVFDACVQRRVCGLHLEKATVTLTRHSEREPDFDGLVSSWKWIVDGLVYAGVIDDDKQSVIGSPIFLWKKAKRGEGKVTVRVEDPLDLDLSAIRTQLPRHAKLGSGMI